MECGIVESLELSGLIVVRLGKNGGAEAPLNLMFSMLYDSWFSMTY